MVPVSVESNIVMGTKRGFGILGFLKSVKGTVMTIIMRPAKTAPVAPMAAADLSSE